MFHLCRVMYLDKEPLFIDSSWIPLSRYPDFDEIYVEGSSTYQLFQERFDTRVVSDKKTIDIFAATRPQAKWLNANWANRCFASAKSPLIRMTNRCTSPNSSAAPIASP